MSPSPEFNVSRFPQLEVALVRDPGFLPKRMQHVDSFSEASYVDHAIRTGVIPHAEFLDSLSNRRHRFEIGWPLAVLDSLRLEPCIVPRIFRKLPEALQRVSEKAQRLHELVICDWIYSDKHQVDAIKRELKGVELGIMRRARSLRL